MDRRVAITGIGVVSPLGADLPTIWRRWGLGESAVRSAGAAEGEIFPGSRCARTPDDGWAALVPNRRLVKFMNREAHMAAAAAALALADSGLGETYPPERRGVYMGTGLTSSEIEELIPVLEASFGSSGEFSCRRLGEAGLASCNPLLSFKLLPNMALCYISMLYGLRGDNLVFNPWPGNAAQAIMAGARAIAWGEADCALVGGCDCKTHYIGLLTFSQMGLLSPSGECRPFERDRDGFVPGEGAAILVLEDLDGARRRRAPVYAEIRGFGEGTDSRSTALCPTRPDVLEEAMGRALAMAGAGPDEIGGVFCSAGGHPAGDLAEAEAVASVFDPVPPLHSVKGLCGDMLAAAPPLALSLAAFALRNRLAPPALRPRCPDPALPGAVFRDGHLQVPPDAFLVNAFDLGHAKVSLAVRRAA
jgi:3-oxoacyl-[acyl-carrier-protein] synthase II